MYFTPTSALWLNMVEGWFALLTRCQFQRGAFAALGALEVSIQASVARTNAGAGPFVRTKSDDAILDSAARFRPRIFSPDR